MTNYPSQIIKNLLNLLILLNSELKRPVHDPLGIYALKPRSLTIYSKPPMAITTSKSYDYCGIELYNMRFGKDKRFLEFLFLNSRLIPIINALESIYKLISTNKDYLNFSTKKVLITYIIGIELIDHGDGYPESRRIEITLHRNTVVTNNTTWSQFYSFIRGHIKHSYLDGYNFDTPTMFRVRVWDVDHLANTQIKNSGGTLTIFNKVKEDIKAIDPENKTGMIDKISSAEEKVKDRDKSNKRSKRMSAALRKFLKDQGRGFSTMATQLNNNNNLSLNQNQLISPLTRRATKLNNFATMDIETLEFKGHQMPILISIKLTSQVKVFRPNKLDLQSVFFMWVEFLEYLEQKSEGHTVTIFTHNLGGFDGIFISKFVNSYFESKQVETVVDSYRKYISIKIKLEGKTFVFIDSFRIFPVSLENLCKIFEVEGKIMPYNTKWNKVTIFDDKEEMKKLVKYVSQDSLALFKALKVAQKTYLDKYGIDITSVVSLPMLAMRIFRLNFLKEPIPILTGFNEYFVRKAYFGGAVDIYKAHAKNCYYYDIVSLYPFAMCKLMPIRLLETLTGPILENFDIENFFGFIELDLECPQSVKRPVLPFKWQNRTIYPKGKFSGVYFSEEIKDMLNLGYKIVRIKSAKRFSSGYVFNEYVEEMFNLKKNAVGAERWIAKLLLNSLYGTFARKQDMLRTMTVQNSELPTYLVAYPSGTILDSGEDTSTILFEDKPNDQALDQLGSVYVDDSTFRRNVKANVAIAAAITSYARIHMNKIKQLPSVIYSDTDSAITTEPLSDHLIGKEMGMFKDELNGCVIKEIFVLGIKQYGFWYLDHSGQRVEKSVWAGYTRNSLPFEEIKEIFNGKKITKVVDNRFFRSLEDLTVTIKPVKLTLQFKPHKVLIDNNYLAPTIGLEIKDPVLIKLEDLIYKLKNS